MHVCCAPDATTAYLRLKDKGEVTMYFYNPNIHPRSEYIRRLEAARKLARLWNVDLIEGKYEPDEYFKAVKGYENLGEMSYRCFLCIRQRLLRTAELAKKLGYGAFSTSLPTSPKKSYQMVLEVGEEAEKSFGVKFIIEDFKKNGGYPLSVKLSKELDLYRQNYCGCIFSYYEAEEKRKESRRRRKEKLMELLRKLDLSEDFEIDQEELSVSGDLIKRLGLENFGEILKLARPKKLVVDVETYENFWMGKKNARFGKFKVRIIVKDHVTEGTTGV